jgi:lipopolysaccharide export system permease protein
MRKMTWYVLAEILKVFTVSLVALTGAGMLWGVIQEAVRYGLPLGAVSRLLPYVVVEYIRYVFPAALLLAATTVYSRMSGCNEVMALKALGLSPMVILWPTLILALGASLVAVWLNDKAVSWGRVGAERVIVEAVEEIAYGMLQTEHRYKTPFFSINVMDVDERRLILPTVSFQARNNVPAMTIEAQEAELQADPEENVLRIVARKGGITIETQPPLRYRFDALEKEIPLSDASRKEASANNPSCMPLSDIPPATRSLVAKIERQEEELAALAAWQLLTGQIAPAGNLNHLGREVWGPRLDDLGSRKTSLARMRTEPHRRWAGGFSCLCFVLIGAPVAIWRRDRDFLKSFALCFIPILIIYYPALMFGLGRAKDGTSHPFSVWGGNLLLVVLGLWMLRKVLRH